MALRLHEWWIPRGRWGPSTHTDPLRIARKWRPVPSPAHTTRRTRHYLECGTARIRPLSPLSRWTSLSPFIFLSIQWGIGIESFFFFLRWKNCCSEMLKNSAEVNQLISDRGKSKRWRSFWVLLSSTGLCQEGDRSVHSSRTGWTASVIFCSLSSCSLEILIPVSSFQQTGSTCQRR